MSEAPGRIDPAALLELLQALRARGYGFVTPTPATHARVLARTPGALARDLRGVLGWSLPFDPDAIDGEIVALLDRAGVLDEDGGGRLRATIRVSSLGGHLFAHSAYPTDDADAVFFGPDSYRFADLIRRELDGPRAPPRRIVDIGTGAGVGAIVAGRLARNAEVHGTDTNPRALMLAEVNAAAAGVSGQWLRGDTLDPVVGAFDVILANPPYIADPDGPEYRDGGDMHGGEVALTMAEAALDRLAPAGRLVLYTGSAIVAGRDALGQALAELGKRRACRLVYREIDPDVFGEELVQPAYGKVERIAVVSAVFTAPAG